MRYQPPSTQRRKPTTLPRPTFTRSAIFTALASTLVGFGSASSALAAEDIPADPPVATSSSLAKYNDLMTVEDDDESQLDTALDALRLRKAVEQGVIDQSVLEAYTQQNYSNKNPIEPSLITPDSNEERSNSPVNDAAGDNQPNISDVANQNLEQEALSIQQQGYQAMTPEEIERELATVDVLNTQNGNSDIDFDSAVNANAIEGVNADIDNSNNSIDADFDNPVSTLDSAQAPIGLDTSLDATVLPSPNNLDTLNREQDSNESISTVDTEVETLDNQSIPVDERPINVSDAVSSNGIENDEQNPVQTLAQQQDQATGAEDTITETQIEASTGQLPIDDATESDIAMQQAESEGLNPDDYLPDYQATEAVDESLLQAAKPKPKARNSSSFIKRIYNRLFNGGVTALPHVETTVYLQQPAANNDINARPQLIKADEDIQPINNIKAALDDTTVQSVVDFTAALPRLRQNALDAARAVGYYDVTLRLRQPNADTIDVIIESLGEPVRVESRVVDIRGEGSEQEEFQSLEADLLPKEGDIFNHRVYKNSKAALEALSNTYGYFDQYWLNKSVDIILPDNTADMSLVYDTGERYEFDEVVFFTYDEATNTLTRDPDQLPVEKDLLEQLIGFKAGEPFYRPAITKFSNDLSATRYFNTVNVETILPPDESSASGTLAFDNMPTNTDTTDILDDDINEGSGNTNDNAQTDEQIDVSASGERNSDLAVDSDNDNDNVNDNEIANDGIDIDASSSDDEVINAADISDSDNVIDETDIAPIEFTIDEETSEKLAAIKQKAERLTLLPDDRVLDEQEQEKADSILGKISDSISNVAEKIFPDDETVFDEDFVPPTLEGRIAPEQVQESKKVPLYVFVSSEKPRDAQVGLGYGTDTGVRATGRIDYNLINRQGYQAGSEVEISSIKKNATIYGSRPWKHPLNDKLDARLTYEEQDRDQGEGNFDLSTTTLEARLARNIRRESGWDSSTFIRYRLDKLETGLDDDEITDLPVDFTSGNPKQRALLLGYGISKTNVDNALIPTRGYRQYYGVEVGSDKVLSDTDMAIVHAGISGLYSFGADDKHQVLGGLNGGYIWADDFYDVPYNLRFFAGGDQSLRGYDYESLSPKDSNGNLTGGQVLAVGSAEYNYEFRPGFRGAVFTDVGNAYDKNFGNETKVGVGVGIRWASPVGVVRVDVAAGVTEDSVPIRLHFFIGSPL
ncbi:autotransporter assembly complex family protein [uncultured Psychrobacter sp.]|uniref:autotransporter assembly complex protein TamA n=1 Tax=uncultured Psychrobacter sp. TaxID=259303 RepID=UPI003457FA93